MTISRSKKQHRKRTGSFNPNARDTFDNLLFDSPLLNRNDEDGPPSPHSVSYTYSKLDTQGSNYTPKNKNQSNNERKASFWAYDKVRKIKFKNIVISYFIKKNYICIIVIDPVFF